MIRGLPKSQYWQPGNWLSLTDIALALGVHRRTVNRWVALGLLPGVQVHCRLRIRVEEADKLIENWLAASGKRKGRQNPCHPSIFPVFVPQQPEPPPEPVIREAGPWYFQPGDTVRIWRSVKGGVAGTVARVSTAGGPCDVSLDLGDKLVIVPAQWLRLVRRASV